jgi:hypothetical protein
VKNETRTPAEVAQAALKSPSLFCNLLSDARSARFPGYWSGSAFRSHPCGVIEGTIKMTNHWRTDNSCDIAITDGEGWSRDYSTDSFGHGSPHPQAIGGKAYRVWDHGRWLNDEAKATLEQRVTDLLTRMAEHVANVRAKKEAEDRRQAEERRVAHESGMAAALAKATT